MTDNTPDFQPDSDDEYPPPPEAMAGADDPEPVDGDPEMAPPPASAFSELAVPRARREVKAAMKAATDAMTTLERVRLGEAISLDRVAIDAVVCAVLDRQTPLPDSPAIERLRQRVSNGEFRPYLPAAIDEIEDVVATFQAALKSLAAASMLGEPLPGEWANLPPVPLARKLNGLGHALLRGRIPGTSF
jgi:hypothetical protein